MPNVGDWVCLKNPKTGTWGPASKAEQMAPGWDVIVELEVGEDDLDAGQARPTSGIPSPSPIARNGEVICTGAHYARVTDVLGSGSVKISVYVPYT